MYLFIGEMMNCDFDQPFHHVRIGGGPADAEDSSEQHPVFLVQLLVLHSKAERNIHERTNYLSHYYPNNRQLHGEKLLELALGVQPPGVGVDPTGKVTVLDN